MLAEKLNHLIERAVIVFVCLWGSWALYYWAMVLIGNASYSTLKDFTPILVLQILASLLIFFRMDLGISRSEHSRDAPRKWLSAAPPGKRFYLLALTATALALIVVYAVNAYNLSRSSLYYNLFWVLLLPVFLAYLFRFKIPKIEISPRGTRTETDSQTFDILLLLIATATLAFKLYGINVHTFDDAYYAHVISSTLGNTELPVQGQDLLLGTGAPYTLHPAYRIVGYEVLIALMSDLLELDPLHLYYDVFPIFGAIFWISAAYMFMRNLGTPYPGFAVTVCMIAMVFWGGGFAPGMPLAYLNWGKCLLFLIAAPLLFVFVSVFVRSRSLRSWFLLFLAVSSVGILSSTALYLAPASVGLACLVFLAPNKANIRVLLLTLCSLFPFVLFLVYTAVMLKQAPSHTGGHNAGYIAIQGEAFGGIYIQALLLAMFVILPVAARTTGNAVFQVNIYKISMVGLFTVMTPYLLEVIAVLTGTKLLSWRLQYSYPTVLLLGIMASIAMAHVKHYPGTFTDSRPRYAVIAVTLILYGVLFGVMDKHYLFGEWRSGHSVYIDDFEEAKATRALIPDGAFVAAGDMDDILPVFPNPPSFIQSKYYLGFHRKLIPQEEFWKRNQLFWVVQNRLPREGTSVEETLNWVVSTADSLGVTTLVYHTVGGRHRPHLITWGLVPGSPEIDAKRSAFVDALTAHLRLSGYDCVATPSDRTRVCNKKT